MLFANFRSADRNISTKQKELDGHRKALNKTFEEFEKEGFASLSTTASTQRAALFADGGKTLDPLIKANTTKIAGYESQIAKLSSKDSAAAFQHTLALAAGIGADLPPVTPSQGTSVWEPENYWTTIALEISSIHAQAEGQVTNENFSRGMSDSYGWNYSNQDVSYEHQSQKAFAQLANSHINVSFDCLRVDIQRPWLRSEIFYDRDLDVAPNQR